MFQAGLHSSLGCGNVSLLMLQGRGDTTKQAKLVHSGELSDRVWCRKRNETGSEQKAGNLDCSWVSCWPMTFPVVQQDNSCRSFHREL